MVVNAIILTNTINYMKKNSSGIIILLIGVFLVLTNCEREYFEKENIVNDKTNDQYSIKKIDFNEIKKNKSVLKILNDKNVSKSKNNTLHSAREIFDSIHDFTIDTNDAIFIEYGDYHSYTFSVYRNYDCELTENLLLSLQMDSTYKSFIVTYDLNQDEKEAISNQISIDLEDKISVIEIELDPDLILYGKIRVNPDGTCDELTMVTGPQGYDTVHINANVPCPDESNNVDDPNEIDEGDSSNNGEDPDDYLPDTSGDVDNNSSGGGGEDGETNDTSGNEDSDNSNLPVDDENCILDVNGECIKDITTPKVRPKNEDKCKDLKEKITDIPIIKTRLHTMKVDGGNFEKGLRVDVNPNTGEYTPTDILDNDNGTAHIRIPVNPFTVVIAHSHLSEDVFEMFSGADIFKLGEVISYVRSSLNPVVETNEITHILIADGRTFAVTFDNEASIQVLMDIFEDKTKRAKFKKRLDRSYNSDHSGFPLNELQTTIEKQQKHLYNLFSKFNLKLSLYEANYDSNGLIDNWQKINKDTLEKEPCL